MPSTTLGLTTSQGSHSSLVNVATVILETLLDGATIRISVLMLAVSGEVTIMSNVSGCKLWVKIPPNATARKFAAMTIMEARKWKIWPWWRARGAMRTGGILVYLSPREELGHALPL